MADEPHPDDTDPTGSDPTDPTDPDAETPSASPASPPASGEDVVEPAVGSEVDEITTEAIDAMESVEAAAGAVVEAVGGPEAVDLPEFGGAAAEEAVPAGMQLLGDVALDVKIELGRTKMFVEDVLRLGTDSVIELDKAAGDPVDIFVNNRHVARGEVLVLSESFAVRVSEIIDTGRNED